MERIVYGGVANPSGIQVYHSDFLEINPIISALIGSIDFSQDQKRSFGAHERTKSHTIQYMVENNIAYISSATANFPHRICFKFLESLAAELKATDFNSPKAIPQFEHFIRNQIKYFSSDEGDPISKAKKDANVAAKGASNSFQIATERDEEINKMHKKASKVEEKSVLFKKEMASLRCDYFRRNMKLTIILIVILLAIAFTFLLVVLYLVYV